MDHTANGLKKKCCDARSSTTLCNLIDIQAPEVYACVSPERGRTMATPLLFYPHRHNENGTYDSICLKCFATVATTLTEPELAFHDRRHICDPLLLTERYLFNPPHSQWPATCQPNELPRQSND